MFDLDVLGRSSLVVVLAAACCLAACGGGVNDSLGGGSGDGVVTLSGPWPATVEGRFEIADIQDAGGGDYYASGWIETPEGDVMVHALGQVLEAGGAAEGGPVRAKVRPSDEEGFYEIVEITRID